MSIGVAFTRHFGVSCILCVGGVLSAQVHSLGGTESLHIFKCGDSECVYIKISFVFVSISFR